MASGELTDHLTLEPELAVSGEVLRLVVASIPESVLGGTIVVAVLTARGGFFSSNRLDGEDETESESKNRCPDTSETLRHFILQCEFRSRTE